MTARLPDTIEATDKALAYYATMRTRYTSAVPKAVRDHDAAKVDELLEWRLMLTTTADDITTAAEAGEPA